MSQIIKKYITDNAVGASKIQLENNLSLRARNSLNTSDIDLIKLTDEDRIKVGPYKIPSTDGTPGQLLRTNGSGSLLWSGQYNVEYYKLSELQVSEQKIILDSVPYEPNKTLFDVLHGGGYGVYGFDFTVIGTEVSWNVLNGRFNGILDTQDEIRIIWY